MTLQTRKFVRKPIHVEAIRITEENFEEVRVWCRGQLIEAAVRTFKVPVNRPLSPKQTFAHVGDWVLSASTGFKVYPDKIFKDYFVPSGVQIINHPPAPFQRPKPGPRNLTLLRPPAVTGTEISDRKPEDLIE